MKYFLNIGAAALVMFCSAAIHGYSLKEKNEHELSCMRNRVREAVTRVRSARNLKAYE